MFKKKRVFKHDKDSFIKSLGVEKVEELVAAHEKVSKALDAFSDLHDGAMKSEMIELMYNMAQEDELVFLVIVMRAYEMFKIKSVGIAVPPPEVLEHVKKIFAKIVEAECDGCEEGCDKEEKQH